MVHYDNGILFLFTVMYDMITAKQADMRDYFIQGIFYVVNSANGWHGF